jgi:ABC-type uncharacterized transport system auxiliary subunit
MKAWTALLPCVLLGACAVARERVALRDVPLDRDAVPAGLARLDAQLHVAVPHAAEPLGDVRIAVRGSDDTYAVLPRIRWREPAPGLVQTLLLQALERCACLAAVARSGTTVHADFLLTIELRELAIHDEAPDAAAVARLALSLVGSRDGRVVAASEREHRAPLPMRSDAAGVEALSLALNAAAGDAVAWVHESLARAAARRNER